MRRRTYLFERGQLARLAQSALLAGLERGRMADVVILQVTVTGELFPLPEKGQVGEGLGGTLLIGHVEGCCRQRRIKQQDVVHLVEEGVGRRCGLGCGVKSRQER